MGKFITLWSDIKFPENVVYQKSLKLNGFLPGYSKNKRSLLGHEKVLFTLFSKANYLIHIHAIKQFSPYMSDSPNSLTLEFDYMRKNFFSNSNFLCFLVMSDHCKML